MDNALETSRELVNSMYEVLDQQANQFITEYLEKGWTMKVKQLYNQLTESYLTIDMIIEGLAKLRNYALTLKNDASGYISQ